VVDLVLAAPLPPGGNSGDALLKPSATDFDAGWSGPGGEQAAPKQYVDALTVPLAEMEKRLQTAEEKLAALGAQMKA
jgi:hypothetical protein